MGLMDRFKKKIPSAPVSDAKEAPDKKAEKLKKAEKVKEEVAQEVAAVPARKTTTAHRIIIRPLVTEKAATMQSMNQYAFVVANDANKTQVKQAIKELYGVDTLAINVINVQGKHVRFGRGMGRRSDFKKAIITVPKGSNITIHEGV